MVSILALSILCIVSNAFDFNDILRADITCCPPHDTQGDCESEGGTDCKWIADPQDPIAVEGGSQCLGQGYVLCKQANINAICVPPGKPAPGPAPAPGEPGPAPAPVPVCFVIPVTKTPTKAPVNSPTHWPTQSPVLPPTRWPTTKWPSRSPIPPTPPCELGVNYEFEGYPCQISGDPHTKIFNGNNHDFQGQPDQNGKDQFYYVHTCHGFGPEQMPFNILATHYRWKTYPVSGIDYLTIELYDTVQRQDYLIFLSSSLHQWVAYIHSREPHKTKYEHNNPAHLNSLPSNVETFIGSRFNILFKQESSAKVSLRLTIDHHCEVKIYMQKQTNLVGDRYRMHYVWIKQSECYKCVTCGLCGNFQDIMTGAVVEQLETCDGNKVDYRAGWNAVHTPEAYDPDGWTWEKNYVLTQCKDYDIQNNNGPGFHYVDACQPNVKGITQQKCDEARVTAAECCNTIGFRVCDELLKDCYYDACVEAHGIIANVEAAVREIFTKAIEETLCTIPNIGDKMSDFTPGLVVSTQNNHYKELDIGRDAFWKLFVDSYKRTRVAIIRRECAGCKEDHKDIYYRRLTGPKGFDPHGYMKQWLNYDNILGTNFNLYGTLEDAIKQRNPWRYCNYNQRGIGAFGDCGATAIVSDNWCSDTIDTERECRFSIYTGPPPEMVPPEMVPPERAYLTEFGKNKEWIDAVQIRSDVNNNNNNIGLSFRNGYISIFFVGAFIIFLFGVVKYISSKRNDKYIPIKDPIKDSAI